VIFFEKRRKKESLAVHPPRRGGRNAGFLSEAWKMGQDLRLPLFFLLSLSSSAVYLSYLP